MESCTYDSKYKKCGSVESCTYTVTPSNCDGNVAGSTCERNGTTYYERCSGQECHSTTPTCNYTVEVGPSCTVGTGDSCIRNGIKYWEACQRCPSYEEYMGTCRD